MNNKIVWYLARLRAMSLAEMIHRAYQRLVQEIGKKRSIVPFGSVDFTLSELEIWKNYLEAKSIKCFYQDEDKNKFVEVYKKLFPIDCQETISNADMLLENRIGIFNRQLNYGEDIPWHEDPITNNTWPLEYWPEIDIRDGTTIGGVKWVWEINRHHHLVTLAKACFLSGKREYAAHAVNQLIDWIEKNPVDLGVNWTSSLELAIRIINWIWILAFIRDFKALDPEKFITIINSIAQQADHISRNLSLYSSANNHLIGEAGGLAIAGISLPWLDNAQDWRDTGIRILTDQISKQINEEGVPKEQALHYLGFVLDFYILTITTAKLNQIHTPDEWNERLFSAFNFITQLMDDEGNVPSIGDSDDGLVVRLSQRNDTNSYQSQLATAAVMFQKNDFKIASQGWDEKSHWLFGELGYQSYNNLSSNSEPKKSTLFPLGGYCVMRSSQCVFIFDCGPLGYLSTAAHGHADALSFSMSWEGVPIFIDPGTYAYQEGKKWRTYFRSTAAHNTVVVDGRDQSEMLGAFLWGRKACSKLLYWSSNSDYDIAIAEHDGFMHTGVLHRRMIIFSKTDFIIIVDDLLGEGEHDCSQFWHFPIECDLGLMSEMVQAKVNNISVYLIPIQIDENANRIIYKGNKSPIQGWVSSRYAEIQSAPVLSYQIKKFLPQRWVFRIQIKSDENDFDISEIKRSSIKIVNKLESEVHL